MEILSFLRLTGRRVVGLSLVAGLAGAGAGYAVTTAPASYQSTATVFVGQALPPGSSSFDLPALVADFQAALGLAPVLAGTAEAAGLAEADFLVVADRNGDGGTVRVTATAPTAAGAETVASTISVEAMRFITTRQVDRAVSLEAQRRDEAEAARTAVSELDAENGFIDPVSQYAAVQAQATQLQLEAENPGSNLTDVQRAGQLEQARSLSGSLPQLALKAQQYRTATQTVADAEANVSAATRDRVAAEAVQGSATSPEAVAEDGAAAISPLPAIMRASGAAVIVTAAAGVGLLALLDDRRRRRIERSALRSPTPTDRPADAEAEADAEPAQVVVTDSADKLYDYASDEGTLPTGEGSDTALAEATDTGSDEGSDEGPEEGNDGKNDQRGGVPADARGRRGSAKGRAALSTAGNGRD